MKSIIRSHIIIGLLSLTAFVISGLYMRNNVPNIDLNDEKLRILFRANHIYILLTSIINLCLGIILDYKLIEKLKILFYISSICLILATISLNVSFYIEPIKNSLNRPITANSLYVILGSVVIQLIIIIINKNKKYTI